MKSPCLDARKGSCRLKIKPERETFGLFRGNRQSKINPPKSRFRAQIEAFFIGEPCPNRPYLNAIQD